MTREAVEFDLELNKRVAQIMANHHVSPKTGFLAEQPWRYLANIGFSDLQQPSFADLDILGYSLPGLVRSQCVTERIGKLPVPGWLDKLPTFPRSVRYRLMLIYGMAIQAFFHETLRYKTMDEAQRDVSVKDLPPQLALPHYLLCAQAGMRPTLTYGLYALWNGFAANPTEPIGLDNVEIIHTFTNSVDEKWFIAVHQVIEAEFAQAIPALLAACVLSEKEGKAGDYVLACKMTGCLSQAGYALPACIATLRRMQEHCDPYAYFGRVRLFYMFPRNVRYQGVLELNGKPQNYFGETGGQTPFMHFLMAVVGINFDDDLYFPRMRQYMPDEFRDLILLAKHSHVREFVEKHHQQYPVLRSAYNVIVRLIEEWRRAHGELARDYVHAPGDSHGTGTSPHGWLEGLRKRTQEYYL